MKYTLYHILLFVFLAQLTLCDQCPKTSLIGHPETSSSSYIYWYMEIPETSIVLYYNQNGSYQTVYYIDFSGPVEEIIHVVHRKNSPFSQFNLSHRLHILFSYSITCIFVLFSLDQTTQAEFTVLICTYIKARHQLFITNYLKFMIVNPYTFEVVDQYELIEIQKAELLGDTNYVVLLMLISTINILDLSTMEIVKSLDCTRYPNQYINYQFDFNQITLKDGTFIFLVVADFGLFSWIFDVNTLDFSYNGFILRDGAFLGTYFQISALYKIFQVPHAELDLFFMIGVSNQNISLIEIVDIKTKSYHLWDMTTISTLDNTGYTNMKYIDGPTPTIYINSFNFLYVLEVLIDFTSKTVKYTNLNNRPSYSILINPQQDQAYTQTWLWGEDYIIIGADKIYKFQISTKTMSTYLDKLSTVQRRFKYEDDSQEFYFSLYTKTNNITSINYFSRNHFAAVTHETTLSSNITLPTTNSGYRVKNCTACFVFKAKSTLLYSTQVYPTNNVLEVIDMKSQGISSWSDVGEQIDAFFYQGSTCVVLGLPKVTTRPGYLFLLLNVSNQTFTQLGIPQSSNYTSYNNKTSSFAIASLFDTNNQEIIGLDVEGNIYFWDLVPPFAFKRIITLSNCLTPVVGDIFHFNNNKWIIVQCANNNNVIIYDTKKGEQSILKEFTLPMKFIRAFQLPNIIILGGVETGNILIFKFNTLTYAFEYLLTLQPASVYEEVIWVEILKNQSLWIQYKSMNKFFEIGLCLEDVNKCVKCEDTAYYSIQSKTTKSDFYGNGTIEYPYITSQSIMTQFLKANLYKSTVLETQLMEEIVFSNPSSDLELFQNLFNATSVSSMGLHFKSSSQSINAKVYATQLISFSSFQYITFSGIEMSFVLTSEMSSCGLSFNSIINGVNLINLSMKNANYHRACFQVTVDSTNLYLNQLQLNNLNFTSFTTVIEVSNSTKIIMENVEINNCQFGDSTSFLRSSTSTNATFIDLRFLQNKCNNWNRSSVTVPFFEAGLFEMNGITISENEICNKIMFQTLASSTQTNQTFKFANVKFLNNQILATSPGFFIDISYPMITNPDHIITIKDSEFSQNELLISESSLSLSSLIITNKLKLIDLQSIDFTNHSDISFGIFSNSNSCEIAKFNCVNSQDFFDSHPISSSSKQNMCLSFTELKIATISNLFVIHKQILDQSLISITNSNYENTIYKITSSIFSNNSLFQSMKNNEINPLKITTINICSIVLDDCTFTRNSFSGPSYSLLYGTSAIKIHNYLGSVKIMNSSFSQSVSNSKYNVMYIISDSFEISNCKFTESTYSGALPTTNTIEGGFIHSNIRQLSISDSTFKGSFAKYGAFLYIESFYGTMNVEIKNTEFSEGFARGDGSAIFFDGSSSQLKFICDTCRFNNIFAMPTLTSSIAFKDSAIQASSDPHSMQFKNGYIHNIYGFKDTLFISIKRIELSFDSVEFLSDTSSSPSFLPSPFENSQYQHQSTIAKATLNSTLNMINCQILDSKPQLTTSTLPLLILSSASRINLNNVKANNIQFSKSAIEVTNDGILSIKSCTFQKITQLSIQNNNKNIRRNLLQATSPVSSAPSLVIISSSSLISLKSSFANINCLSSCNGAIFQLIQSNFTLESTHISDCLANFGGALFVSGTRSTNMIKSSTFENNVATNDGGALYFVANSGDTGQGGAMFIRSRATNPIDQIINITGTTIEANVAQVGAGINSQNINPNISEDTKFKNNKGNLFGSDTISYPSHLDLQNPEEYQIIEPSSIIENDRLIINDFSSGSSLSNLNFVLKSQSNEEIIPQGTELTTFQVSVKIKESSPDYNKLNLRGDTSVEYTSNGFQFNDLVLVGVPGQSATLNVSSSEIYVFDSSKSEYTQNYWYEIDVNLRQCKSGEIINSYGEFKECQKCKQGTYSFDIKTCQDCIIGATCSGGDSIIPNSGYWQRETGNLNIIACSNEPENCKGRQSGNQSCYEGHIGALCEECDIQGEYWGSSYGKYGCVKCDTINLNVLVAILMAIWVLVTMYIAIKGGIDIIEQSAAASTFKKLLSSRHAKVTLNAAIATGNPTIFQRSPKQEHLDRITISNKDSVYIKMVTNYFFIVSQISTFNLTIPTSIFGFSTSIGQPLQQSMNSLDCIFKDFDSSIPFIYLRLIFTFVIPFVYFLIFITCTFASFRLKKRPQKYPSYLITTAIIFLVLYIQPDLVSQSIALLSCRQIGDNNYILSNVSYECNTDDFYSYSYSLVTPILILLAVIIPIVLFWLVKKNEKSLDTNRTKLRFGILYKEYKPNAYYWEFIKMAEKLLIILTLNFFSQQIVTKGILVFIVISVYSVFSLIVQPFKEQEVNRIDFYSTNVCASTVLLAVFLYKNEYDYYVIMTMIMIVGINIWFIQLIIRKLLQAYSQKFRTILIYLRNKFPILSICCIPREPEKPKFNRPELREKLLSISKNFLFMSQFEKKQFMKEHIRHQIEIEHPNQFKKKQDYSEIPLILFDELNYSMPSSATATATVTTQQQTTVKQRSESDQGQKSNQITHSKHSKREFRVIRFPTDSEIKDLQAKESAYQDTELLSPAFIHIQSPQNHITQANCERTDSNTFLNTETDLIIRKKREN